MTTQTVEAAAAQDQTATAKLFARGSDTVVATADTVTQQTNRKGWYRCVFGEVSVIAGTFLIQITRTSDGLVLANWFVLFPGTDGEVVTAYEIPDPATASGVSVTVLPAVGIVADRSSGVTLTPVVGETISQAITVYESDGTTAVDLSSKTLAIVFETMNYTDVATIADADINVSGDDDNVVTFSYPAAVTASERTLRFALRDASAPLTMYLQGICSVVKAPLVDSP